MAEDRDWEQFKQKLKAKTEIDLDLYKEPQMKRRINNLITRAGYKGCVGYFDHVCENKDDFAAFIEYLTINVSEFFRTPEKFSKLETDVIPDLLTRSSKTAQGGGDFDVNELNCEDGMFVPSLAFDPDMIGAWIDCKIRLDDYIPDGYKDLTDTVFVEERI